MKYDLSNKTVLVYDFGSYVEIAERLARDFGKVYYFCPSTISGYPDHIPMDIGRDVPSFEKVKEWASVIDEVDLVYFPDSMEPHLQNDFRKRGKLVFGSVFACSLEHDRGYIKETLKSLGLPVGLYSQATGLDELDQILQNSKDVYVKSSLRGDMETWHHIDYRLSGREIKRMRHEMGLYENKEKYIVEHPIDCIAEIGYDGFCIDGSYPPISMCGIEIKDAGYLGRFVRYQWLPEQIKKVNDAFGPVFNEMGYRGHYSNEIIISKDKRGFLIDNTCRAPQPPTSLMLEAYTNYSQIVWAVANGGMPTIEFENEYGVQLIIKSDIAECEPSPIIVPDEYKKLVKVKNLSIDEKGTWWFTPHPGIKMKEIGSVIGLGNSIEAAVKQAREVSESIQGFDTYVKTDSLDQARKSIDKLTKSGINFI